MKMSRRAARMERHHKRGAGASLNLVSLMDIFTILVFFLLVHSSDVENLPTAKTVRLPESLADKSPKPTVVVTVTGEDILVQGRKVTTVAAVLDTDDLVIEPLRGELALHADRRFTTASGAAQAPREVTIMGDKEIPYRLLKKIMVTCASAKFENISLAVVKKDAAG